ncbi:hypothetical protein [Bifidobacterium callitrichos]|uniref:Putative membrane spanning protein n=1 Tax=Bifidobacterium callitrichos DSM 23973 TaxID=1437609 RepID=A0A087A6W3_9BIFI|nr:hypothetical protein [Bifidobacterium callitrichos]KFI54513.1 putative membrane spanning protein [Bifidobacterium callitrichos DSM 23973]
MAVNELRDLTRRVRAWLREPHFLEKNAIVGALLLVIEMILVPPASPTQMLLALAWLVVVVAVPFRTRLICLLAPVLLLVVPFLPVDVWWASGGTAIITVFLAIGYALSNRAMIGVLLAYSLADAVCFALFDTASIGGGVIRGMVEEFNRIGADGTIPVRSMEVSPLYTILIVVGTFILDLMILGFFVVFGAAFRRASAAGERVARVERMLDRITREQELAHMIHDSVANDMSTIAMLAWRAKAMDDDDEVLDAIYARSHHALDRVHEVIDVLNGKRDITELTAEEGYDAGGAVGAHAGDLSFDAQLEKYIEDQNRAMTMLGLAGVTRFNSAPDVVVPKPVRRVVMGLTEEIYANIVRHCAMDDVDETASAGAGAGANAAASSRRIDEPAYSLFVEITAEHIRISEVNAIADESKTLVHGRRHGSGLALHRAAIEMVGGTLTTSNLDDTWMISADIPLGTH